MCLRSKVKIILTCPLSWTLWSLPMKYYAQEVLASSLYLFYYISSLYLSKYIYLYYIYVQDSKSWLTSQIWIVSASSGQNPKSKSGVMCEHMILINSCLFRMIELYIWYYVMKMAFYLCGPPSSNLHHMSNHEKNIRCIWRGNLYNVRPIPLKYQSHQNKKILRNWHNQ